jgi:cyclase
MDGFTVYPAIDLRQGQVVRLAQGDPQRQTVYSNRPADAARRWLQAGAQWLHVVNLDGAFEQADQANRQALDEILQATAQHAPACRVQFGGGLRSIAALEQALAAGVQRVVLGTAAVLDPGLLDEALRRFGAQRVAAGLDARDGMLMLRGWTEPGGLSALQAARRLGEAGVRTLIFTDIARDGMGQGINLASTRSLARESGLEVIASGGAHSLDDLRQVRRVADGVFLPLTVGGGIRAVEDMRALLLAGADKVSVNTAAVLRPEILTQGAERFGSQCVVMAIDARRRPAGGWEVVTHGGRQPAGLDAVEWAQRGVALGAGEILLTSMDADGSLDGFDVQLTRAVAQAVNVPVIASGGAGRLEHFAAVLTDGQADAALAASLFHDKKLTVGQVKSHLLACGLPIRPVGIGQEW